MEQAKIDRISELTRISRERALTEAELSERVALRKEYLEAIKASLTAQLDNTYIVDEKGEKRRISKKPD